MLLQIQYNFNRRAHAAGSAPANRRNGGSGRRKLSPPRAMCVNLEGAFPSENFLCVRFRMSRISWGFPEGLLIRISKIQINYITITKPMEPMFDNVREMGSNKKQNWKKTAPKKHQRFKKKLWWGGFFKFNDAGSQPGCDRKSCHSLNKLDASHQNITKPLEPIFKIIKNLVPIKNKNRKS